MKIRLLLIIPTMDQGGAEKQLVYLATQLPTEDFDVRVALLTRGGPLEPALREAGIPVISIGKRWKVDPWAYQRLTQVIREFQPHVVHTWIFAANCYGRLAAWREKVPVVVGGERCVDLWKRGYEFAIDRFLAQRSKAILTNSQGVKQFYVQHGVPADRMHVIPNGIALQDPPGPTIRADLLKSLGLSPDSRLVGVVGRLWPQKRIKDAIWAAELINCVRPDVHLLIVGDGPQRWRLERFARQVRIDDHVHFLGHRTDVPAILNALDQFWIASAYEGQSNALMEAMGQRLPVVASDIPGNRDLIQADQTGVLFRVGDRAGLARQSLRLLDDPELAQRLGVAARTRLENEFRLDQMVQRHADLYRQWVAEAAPSAVA